MVINRLGLRAGRRAVAERLWWQSVCEIKQVAGQPSQEPLLKSPACRRRSAESLEQLPTQTRDIFLNSRTTGIPSAMPTNIDAVLDADLTWRPYGRGRVDHAYRAPDPHAVDGAPLTSLNTYYHRGDVSIAGTGSAEGDAGMNTLAVGIL